MSGGSLFLTDKCQVLRPVDEIDKYNNRRRVPKPHLANVPCRYVEKGKTAFNSVTGEWVKTAEVKILVLISAEIETGDIVQNIVTRENATILGSFEVDDGSFIRRGRMATHRTLMVNQIS